MIRVIERNKIKFAGLFFIIFCIVLITTPIATDHYYRILDKTKVHRVFCENCPDGTYCESENGDNFCMNEAAYDKYFALLFVTVVSYMVIIPTMIAWYLWCFGPLKTELHETEFMGDE